MVAEVIAPNKSSSFNTPLALPLELDITADPSVIVQIAWTAFGHIHLLINNAGVPGNTREHEQNLNFVHLDHMHI